MTSKEKICKNCNHFFQTGLAKSWGTSGYCLLIQNDKSTEIENALGITKVKSNAIMAETDTCNKFEIT